MKRIASSEGRKIIRMGPIAFMDLCAMLEQEGGLQSTQRVSIEEQVAKTLYILTHNVRNREVQFWFRRSGETTSRHFHRVLRSIVELEDKYLKQPDGSQIPIEILGNNRFNPFFKDCVGAIDYSRILKDALRRTDNLRIPRGKYYVLDAGFMFPIIASGTEPTYGIKTQNRIIIACCILHNYLMMTDPEEELVAEVDEEIANQSVSEQHGDDHIEEDENEEHTRLGENLRNSTADAMWRAYRS
ncbi:hypothetical protein K1719_031470 [Acacia pycnantha]|nr:hypothetical protein K1719_031470 [Acacia pycnantha]